MIIYSIYKVTNILNQKIYIGYTSSNLENRKSQHIERATSDRIKGKRGTKFHNALLSYDAEIFSWELIYQSLDKNHCKNNMEKYFINEYNSREAGYNGTNGGDGIDSDTMKFIRNDPNSVYNSVEYKNKRSDIQKKIRNDPNSKFNAGDFKKKVSSNMRRMHDDPNSTFNSDEYRKKLSDGAKRFWERRKLMNNN